MSIVCPKCNKDDQVQKVSVIYESGTTIGTYAGPIATVNYSGGKFGTAGSYASGVSSSSTQLAQRLAPPIQPVIPSTSCSFYVGLILIILTLPIGGSALFGVFLGDREVAPPVAVIFLFLTLIGFMVMMSAINQRNTYKNDFPELLATWKKDMTKWNNLFYCHRDGTIFDQRDE